MSCPEDSKNSGIRVRRDTLVTVEDCDAQPKLQHTPSAAVTRSGDRIPRPQQSIRPKSFPGLSIQRDSINGMLRSDTLKHKRRNTGERDLAKELIEFFHDTPPPPGNYMSTPDDVEEKHEKKHKRFSLWPFKRKSRIAEKKLNGGTSGVMKLPDSAVVGRTTGGHRHIAISIPIEYDHIEPVAAASQTERPIESDGAEQADPPEGQGQSAVPGLIMTGDGLLPPPRRLDHGSTHDSNGEENFGRPESSYSRSSDTSVGAHNMTATPFPELTALLPKGSASSSAAMKQSFSNQGRSLRRRPILNDQPSDKKIFPDSLARWSMDPDLLRKRPSTPETFYTTSTELIFSEAATIRIPSPQTAAELSEFPHATSSDPESDSYYTPELSQSPLTISSPETTDAGDPRQDNLSPLNFSTPCQESLYGFSLPDSARYAGESYRPHALSNIASAESVPSTPDVPRMSRFAAAATTPVDTHPARTQRHPRRVHAARDIRTATSTDPVDLLFPVHHSSDAVTPTHNHEHHHHSPNWPLTLTTPVSPDPSPAPARPYHDPTSSTSNRRAPLRTASHRSLLRRYERLTSTHARDMDVLLDRLERLEHTNERWLGALAPLFEGLSRRLVVSSSPSSSSRHADLEMGMERGRGRGRGRVPAARLESMDSLYWGRGGGRAGADINDESWLRSDSGSVSEVVADGGGVAGGPQLGLGGSLAEDGWRTTVAGRHTEAFAREQRHRHRHQHRPRQSVGGNLDGTLDMDVDMDGGLEDPAGWAALESLMRELVLGTRSRGDSMEGRTLVDDSVLGLGC